MSKRTDERAAETVDFGDQAVPIADKQGLVDGVFAKVADRYDVMNDLMSGGLHRLWKDDLVNWLAPPRSARPYRHLDVAGGTGDVARRIIAAAGPAARSTICDVSGQMLEAGLAKTEAAGLGDQIDRVRGNAEFLPFPDKAFDAYTIAFGIRNVPRRELALAEAWRVLKPGGRFMCLEFSHVDVPVLDNLYQEWSFRVIPLLGKLASGAAEPYQYLVESIQKFPDQKAFADLIRAAGFERVAYRNLTGGIVAIHSGWRL